MHLLHTVECSFFFLSRQKRLNLRKHWEVSGACQGLEPGRGTSPFSPLFRLSSLSSQWPPGSKHEWALSDDGGTPGICPRCVRAWIWGQELELDLERLAHLLNWQDFVVQLQTWKQKQKKILSLNITFYLVPLSHFIISLLSGSFKNTRIHWRRSKIQP